MTPTHAESIAALAAALGPLDGIPAATIDVYLAALQDLPADELAAVVRDLIETQEQRWWPTVATLRRMVFERRLGLPSPQAAWELIQTREGRQTAPDPVRRALAAVGGSWALRTGDTEWFRKTFIDQYEDTRTRALAAASGESRALAAATRGAIERGDER